MSFSLNRIVCGDAFTVLPTFSNGCVDLVMFSPPYWGLRDYGDAPQVFGNQNCEHEWFSDDTRFGNMGGGSTKKEVTPNYRDNLPERNFCVKCGAWRGCFGLEPHPQMFIDHMVQLCGLLRRVLKKTGSMYLNLGDTYYGGGGHQAKSMSHGKMIVGSFLSASKAKELIPKTQLSNWLQPKQKLLMPSRVAIALQHDGWILRNDIIWHKPNHMPSSVKDRLTSSYEHIYHFVQARRYYYDLDAIRQPHKTNLPLLDKGVFHDHKQDQILGQRIKTKANNPLDKNPGDTLTADFHSKKEPYSINNPHRVRQLGFKEAQHPKGKNPADVYNAPYSIQPRDKEFVEKRDLPSLEAVKNYLNYWRRKRGYTIEQVEIELQSQAPHHWFNGESYPTKKDWLRLKQLLKFGSKFDKRMTAIFLKLAKKQDNPRGKNPSDFWSINTKPFPQAHFAVYPEKICEMPIKSSCPPHGVVLDPMCGAGTTLLAAHKLGRKWIGIELNPSYVEMAKKRLKRECSRWLTEYS